MAEQGFGGLAAPAPEQLPECEVARSCWLFCGGWSPALWPAYDALYPVDDWSVLIELLTVIRKEL